MALFFSPATATFHDDKLGTVPAGSVAITPQRHAELLAARSHGHTVEAAANGSPCVRRRARPTLLTTRASAIAAVKRQAARRIEDVAPLWRQLNDLRAATASIEPLPLAGIDRFIEIDRIRAISNQLEAAIAGMTAAQLAPFRPSADHHWTAKEPSA